ncbi:hypothetical protein I4U23_018699 [Adineta vaga]|nr:hypothetical protein I4U23_018699 [Adineta vaga]
MNDSSAFYAIIQCRKCERRLNKPLELKCGHLICRDCLETILRNHRTTAECPTCKEVLGDYQIENYTYLSTKHNVSRLILSFSDVNLCETCKQFTTVEECPQCSKDQCDSCAEKHAETHRQPEKHSIENAVHFSDEEKRILESIEKSLTKNEYEDFVHTAKVYLNYAISKSNGINSSIGIAESKLITEEKSILPIKPIPYDWSKHEKFDADDILNSKPERVKQLLRLNFTPRPYQIRMIRAGLKKQNSLVCLQTGAGKTFVAGMVAKFFHILSLQNISNSSRTSSNSGRRFKAVFLVPIKALVDQQYSAFQKVFIDEPDSILKTIENQVGERFESFYQNFDIFFFTVQKFANFVEAKHADLAKFDLIMIDECHHCYDNHPVNSMMRQYHRLKSSGYTVPQIIALTASVGTNKKNAFDHLVHLCANLDCFDICAIKKGVEQEELQNSTNTPLADTIITVPKEENDPIVRLLQDDVMKSIAHRLALDISAMTNEKLENFLVIAYTNACKTNDRDGIIGCDYLRKLNRFLLFYNDLPLEQCMERLEEVLQDCSPSNPTAFQAFCQKKLNELHAHVAKQISLNAPPKLKLQKLVEVLISLHAPNCRGLVLVRTKFHTVALEKFLNEHPQMRKRQISVGHLTGQGSADDLCLPGTQQATVLNEFRKGTKSLLVATDVAQEGLDVAECSYVVRYEFVSNEIGTVQSRGRARAAQSKCFLLTEAQSLNSQRERDNRQREDEMKAAIDEWYKRGILEFRILVEKKQTEIIEELCKNDTQSPITPDNKSQNNQATAREIRCRFCDKYLCNGSSLRYQGTTVICKDPAFEQLVNLPKSPGAKFVCPNPTCQRELGGVILLSRNDPAYALQITALKFIANQSKEPCLYKKWSQYQGYIKPL